MIQVIAIAVTLALFLVTLLVFAVVSLIAYEDWRRQR